MGRPAQLREIDEQLQRYAAYGSWAAVGSSHRVGERLVQRSAVRTCRAWRPARAVGTPQPDGGNEAENGRHDQEDDKRCHDQSIIMLLS